MKNSNTEMGDIYEDVGRHIRARRLHQDLTLEELGELSGLHASYIGQIERGVKKSSLKTVSVIASALGVPPGRLFSDDKETSGTPGLDDAARINTPSERAVLLEMVKRLAKGLRGLRS